jgi:DNA-binding NarL/FixJ family response regulator
MSTRQEHEHDRVLEGLVLQRVLEADPPAQPPGNEADDDEHDVKGRRTRSATGPRRTAAASNAEIVSTRSARLMRAPSARPAPLHPLLTRSPKRGEAGRARGEARATREGGADDLGRGINYDRGVGATRELRVVLADDHEVFRSGLRRGLEASGDVTVVGEAATGDAAVRLTRTQAPDVVVMDLSMPGLGGVEATRRITEECPSARVLVLTGSSEEADVVDAVVAGACGYLLKSAGVDELVAGIEAAAAGDALISPEIAGQLLEHVRGRTLEQARAAVPQLSAREVDVLRLVAQGLENAEIAALLYISPKTVKNHISNILMKLQIDNRIQAAVFAVRRGLV